MQTSRNGDNVIHRCERCNTIITVARPAAKGG
jgi:hypothetical protein